MAPSSTRFMGMDVHQDSLAVAYVAQEHGAEGMDLGAIGTRPWDLDSRIRQRPSTATPPIFVSGAGPGGSWLSRSLSPQGDDCWVVAPSVRPQKAGDPVTTDRRAAVSLARWARAGALTAVSVPTVDADAIRDHTRARDDALSALTDATGRLNAFGRRQNRRSGGRAHGGSAPLRGRSAVVYPTPAQPSVFPTYVLAVPVPPARLPRLDQAQHDHVHAWRVHPGVAALHAWRGVPCPVAVTMVSARGDLPRVDPPRALMKCVGLLPSASSSGAQRRQGSMTTAGHSHARRALVAGAWASRDRAQGSRPRPRRRDTPSHIIQNLGWKAQGRRCQRDRRLGSRGQHAHVVTGALAHALAGFMWAMARAVPVTLSDQQRGRMHPSIPQVPHV